MENSIYLRGWTLGDSNGITKKDSNRIINAYGRAGKMIMTDGMVRMLELVTNDLLWVVKIHAPLIALNVPFIYNKGYIKRESSLILVQIKKNCAKITSGSYHCLSVCQSVDKNKVNDSVI
jgi:hypothetical protein